MAPERQAHAYVCSLAREEPTGNRAKPPVTDLAAHSLVYHRQDPARALLSEGGRPRGGTNRGGYRRGRGLLPTPVRDDSCPAVFGREDVVEVAANLLSVPGGTKARRQFDTGDLRKLLGQKALLERAGDPVLSLVEKNVFERHS